MGAKIPRPKVEGFLPPPWTECFRKPHYLKNVRFFHSFADSCIGTICHHKDFTGRVLPWETFISPRINSFHTQKRFFLARYRSPNGPHLLRVAQPIRSPENPATTVVSIGHLTPWPENPGYRTQVWDKRNNGMYLILIIAIHSNINIYTYIVLLLNIIPTRINNVSYYESVACSALRGVIKFAGWAIITSKLIPVANSSWFKSTILSTWSQQLNQFWHIVNLTHGE